MICTKWKHYGVVFAVNENLSVSYNNHEVTYAKTAGNVDQSSDKDGIAVAYSMGGASIKVQKIILMDLQQQTLTQKTEQKLIYL